MNTIEHPLVAAPLDLRVRLAGCLAEISAIVPALAGAVASYRQAVDRVEPTLPDDVDGFDEGWRAFMEASGADELRAALRQVEDLVAVVDWPVGLVRGE